mmetsp:Transcript_54853/g.169864  ORF Transcript_54853/g.169864 Transcript_54853/m.169864 type:complete len:609 (-) Transcript_54853:66-1892(-)
MVCSNAGGNAVVVRLTTSGLEGDLALDSFAGHWVPCLGGADLAPLQCTCSRIRGLLSTSSIWKEVARAWRYTPTSMCWSNSEVPWRSICELHEHLWHAWRGSPVSMRIGVREELRQQKIADLEVLMVEFLAGEDALALGHASGVVSVWELCASEVKQPSSATGEPQLQDKRLMFNPMDAGRIFQDARTPPQSPSGAQEPRTPPPSPWSGTPARPLASRVLGVFKTSRKHDVQDICAWPSPASRPSALLLGESVWLAAAVGPSAYVWESTGSPERDHPAAALKSWSHRATLSHIQLFPAVHHVVWTVRLGGGRQPHALTVGEDGVLRAWSLGVCDNGSEGVLLWQHSVGDSRQVVVAIVTPSPLDMPNCPAGAVAVARADERSLQLLCADTGKVIETVPDVWPAARGSLPQTAAYDARGPSALFSSITEMGDGTLAHVDLRCPRKEEVAGTLAGRGRVLGAAVAIPAAEVLLAAVHEGDAANVLEVWESAAAYGNERGMPLFRRRVQHSLTNPRLVSVGGRRLALLDPTAFMSRGELRIWEWRLRSTGSGAAGRSAGAERGSRGRRDTAGRLRSLLLRWFNASCCCGALALPPAGCGRGFDKLLRRQQH